MFLGTRKALLVLALTLVVFAASGRMVGQSTDGQSQSQSPDPSRDQSSPPATPPEQLPQHVRVSAGITTGLLIRKVNPVYPKKARKKHIQGQVVLAAKIDKNGDVANLTLVSGDALLAEAAIDAVKQWKYRPYFFKGQPVEVDTQILVNFTLSPN